VKIEALRCRQKGKIYFLSDVDAQILDSMTIVPRFDWELSYEGMADKILSYGLGTATVEAWQRELIKANLKSIASWWDDYRSNLVNCVVIGFQQNPTRPAEGGGTIPVGIRETKVTCYGSKELVTIEVDNWLSPVCPNGHRLPQESGSDIYFDACPETDCEFHENPWRPAHIIDGQHRIRGIQTPPSFGSTTNPNVEKEPIPVAILGPTEVTDASPITSPEQAKIFTEISGKAVALEDEHRLFLFFVFRTGVPGSDMTVPPQPAINPLRQAYETILRLAGSAIQGNPLSDRIKVLKPRAGGTGRTTSLSFNRALRDWFEPWFKPRNIWANVSTIDAAQEIADLVVAIQTVWTGNSPVSGTPYWQSAGPPARAGIFSHPGGVGDMSAFLRVIMDLYPVIRSQVPRPVRSAFIRFLRDKLADATSPVGFALWDGSGWNEIRAPDYNYTLFFNVLHDIFTGGGKVIYDLQHHPARPKDLNAYLNLDPTIYEVSTSLGSVGQSGTTIPVSSPIPNIDIIWRTPLLARKTVAIEIREDGGTPKWKWESVNPGDLHTMTLNGGTDYTGNPGTVLRIELKARNHRGEQDRPFTIDFQF
jgi:hypothetical protein